MYTSDFHYDLPRELIAQFPAEPRSASRLLVVDAVNDRLEDRHFVDFIELLRPGDLLVLNDTRVIPARLFARKESGGRVEVLIERALDEQRALAQLRANKPVRCGARLLFGDKISAEISGREGEFYTLRFSDTAPLMDVLQRLGHVPLPPYIERVDEPCDRERYQTVYACRAGAVAAPTAGLHFDKPLLGRLASVGVQVGFVTLHIGAGTFQPIRVSDIREHHMHAEYVDVSEPVCTQIMQTRARGGRVVAVGTTVVRALETAAHAGRLTPFKGETQLYIYPGFRFRVVDALLTNFHLPGSSLLVMVCAFAGRQCVLGAYRHAVTQRYRFFSYGDAMLVLPQIQDQRCNVQTVTEERG
jgi:S-adenosylmethionine:tRNA ribosyltransferase-isomerase